MRVSVILSVNHLMFTIMLVDLIELPIVFNKKSKERKNHLESQLQYLRRPRKKRKNRKKFKASVRSHFSIIYWSIGRTHDLTDSYASLKLNTNINMSYSQDCLLLEVRNLAGVFVYSTPS